MPAYETNEDGSIRPFSESEIGDFELSTRNVRNGGHPTHERSYGQSTIRRSFFFKWEKLEAVATYATGAAKVYRNPTSGRDELSRLEPLKYPGREEFLCTRIEAIRGYGCGKDDPDTGVPAYEYGEVDLLYEHAPFVSRPDDETSREWFRYTIALPAATDASAITLPGSTMKFVRSGGATPNGLSLPYNTTLIDAQSVVARQWVRVPFEAYQPGSALFTRIWGDGTDANLPYIGTINSATFLGFSGATGYAPGQLLFLGVEDELKRDPTGDGWAWDLTFRWQYKPRTHLLYYYAALAADAANSGWYFAGRGGTAYPASTLPDGVALINSRDHAKLFEVG